MTAACFQTLLARVVCLQYTMSDFSAVWFAFNDGAVEWGSLERLARTSLFIFIFFAGRLSPFTSNSKYQQSFILVFSDQTPTPTRFLKNCEEVGLFNDIDCSLEHEFRKAQEEENNKRVSVSRQNLSSP